MFILVFSDKVRLGISRKSFAGQKIHKPYFLWKIYKKSNYFKMLTAAVVIGT